MSFQGPPGKLVQLSRQNHPLRGDDDRPRCPEVSPAVLEGARTQGGTGKVRGSSSCDPGSGRLDSGVWINHRSVQDQTEGHPERLPEGHRSDVRLIVTQEMRRVRKKTL